MDRLKAQTVLIVSIEHIVSQLQRVELCDNLPRDHIVVMVGQEHCAGITAGMLFHGSELLDPIVCSIIWCMNQLQVDQCKNPDLFVHGAIVQSLVLAHLSPTIAFIALFTAFDRLIRL